MATYPDTMAELEALGTAQNRKIYARHGVGPAQFGVSYGNLRALKKQIKTDHALAVRLWASGNHDARILALLIADPRQADAATLDAWAQELDNYVITDALSEYVSRTPLLQAKAEQWMQSDEEWLGTAGWNLLGYLALKDKALPDAYFEDHLAIIRRDIHSARNRVRYAMNNAVIQIGTRNPALAAAATAAAERIGLVEVDHGETGCKTPDACGYIEKVWARKKQKTA